jgi:hypothetical protein
MSPFALPPGLQRVLWISYPNFVQEFVRAAANLLVELGLPVQLWQQAAWPPMAQLRDASTLFIISRGMDISTCPAQPKNFIIHQIEQCSCAQLQNSASAYVAALRKALYIWDYSALNVRTLAKRFSLQRIGLLEFGYHPSLENAPAAQSPASDILFIGTLCPRRSAILAALRAAGMQVRVESKLFGAQKAALISGAKIVLNLHYYVNPSILETERLALLLANRKCIVSETSSDAELDLHYSAGVVFESTTAGLVLRCQELLAQPELRATLERQAYEWFTQEMQLRQRWQNMDELIGYFSSGD